VGGAFCSGVCGGGFCAGEDGCGEVSPGMLDPDDPLPFPFAPLLFPVAPGVVGLASGLVWVLVFAFLFFLPFRSPWEGWDPCSGELF